MAKDVHRAADRAVARLREQQVRRKVVGGLRDGAGEYAKQLRIDLALGRSGVAD